MQTMVVVPTYNEASNLSPVVGELRSLKVPDLQILVVDDNSPDGTGDLADDLSRRYPGEFHVIHRQTKMGLGTAYIAGFRFALEHGADRIVQMDADFSHSPSYIPRFLEELEGDYGVVVGSRYVKGGQLDERWSVGRYLLSWWANSIYTRLILGINIKDATAGFKCWKREVLQSIDLDSIKSSGYVFQVEMAYVTAKMGFRVLEVPIYFEDRRIGQSKMDMRIKLEAAWRVWQVKWRHRHVRPIV
ncbi:MAG: polyprenol monophosphomannose synthase [Anaerolineaceae bacterium 4572_32.1]|nr:MAG: polyprenol monophosphomannose synthase [Anaerolineaceae bacterium 4572_32.1]